MPCRIAVPGKKIEDFCRRNKIRKLSLFGSVLTQEFGPDSDVDVLVEFRPDARVGLIGLAAMELELSEIVGHKVDIRTPPELSRYFRHEVLDSAEEVYSEA